MYCHRVFCLSIREEQGSSWGIGHGLLCESCGAAAACPPMWLGVGRCRMLRVHGAGTAVVAEGQCWWVGRWGTLPCIAESMGARHSAWAANNRKQSPLCASTAVVVALPCVGRGSVRAPKTTHTSPVPCRAHLQMRWRLWMGHGPWASSLWACLGPTTQSAWLACALCTR